MDHILFFKTTKSYRFPVFDGPLVVLDLPNSWYTVGLPEDSGRTETGSVLHDRLRMWKGQDN